MTWHDTFPNPTMYYHAPEKLLRRNPAGPQLDGKRAALQVWTPQRRHEYGDPYTPAQRGHLARVTLSEWMTDGYRAVYDVHQTGNGITATITTAFGQRRMTLPELERLTSITREELRDYAQPNTRTERTIENIFHYRSRTHRRILADLNNIMNAYYLQEAGKTITIQ
jgi:hypothetical protein